MTGRINNHFIAHFECFHLESVELSCIQGSVLVRDVEIDLNTHTLKSSLTKNIAVQRGKEFHGAAGDTKVQQESTENLLCLLFWSAKFRPGMALEAGYHL